MFLTKSSYKSFDAFKIFFKATPVTATLDILLSIIDALLRMLFIALATAYFVDTAIAVLQGTQPRGDIYIPLIILIAVMGANRIIMSVILLLMARHRLVLRHRLNPEFVQRHAVLDYKHIENTDSWELISRATKDPMNSILMGFSGYSSIMKTAVSIIAIMGLIISHVWWAAFAIFAFSAPMLWLSVKAGQKNYQAERDAEKFNRRTTYLDEVISSRENIDERTVFNYGEAVINDWYKQFEAGRLLQLKVRFKMTLMTRASGIILILIGILVALTLVGPVINGELSAGMFMGIISAILAMIQRIGWEVSYSIEQLARGREYMKDLTAFVSLSQAEGAMDEPDPEPLPFKSLEFKNVSFKYPSGERYVLERLSFKLDGGRHYAFVGKNGTGKTTITKLLTGLYHEYEGEILINGKELRTYPAGSIRAMFSVVYQDFARYFISFEDNITIGDIANKPHADDIRKVAGKAGLDELVAGLKSGMSTALGKIKENGQDISGGEWQRIAIARSLISRAPVKILDEPTAALDPVAESHVYEEFEKLMRGKTTIFISHRLGSTKLADEILVIDNGKIAERGSHEELITANGLYTEMFEAQKGWYQ